MMNTTSAHALNPTVDRSGLDPAFQSGARVRRAGTVFVSIALALAFVGQAAAGERSEDFRLRFDCAAVQRPSQQDTARLLGTHNLSQTYRAREQLMQQISRDCRRGVREVVVRANDAFAPITELAAAR